MPVIAQACQQGTANATWIASLDAAWGGSVHRLRQTDSPPTLLLCSTHHDIKGRVAMTDNTDVTELPFVDFERANAPLTRAEAYLILSKFRRMVMALNSSAFSNMLDEPAAARRFALEASHISDEIEPLLAQLLYLNEDNGDES